MLDVVVVGPKMEFKDEWCAQGATEKAGMSKRVVYAKWDIADEDVVPLAFSTYLVWNATAFMFLKNVASVIAGCDLKLKARVFRRMREDIAARLVNAQGRLITELNRRNGGFRA